MGQVNMRGVPTSLMQDMWWFDTDVPKGGQGEGADSRSDRRRPRAGLVLLALVVAADALFFGYRPGISLALFAGLVGLAVWALLACRSNLTGPAVLLCLSVLPVIEHVQALSVAFMLSGTSMALCWAALGSTRQLGAALRRFARLIPLQGVKQASRSLRQLRQQTGWGWLGQLWQGWAFPIAGLLVFGTLILSANPLLTETLSHALKLDIQFSRLIFWLVMALLLWPVLAVTMDAGLLTPRVTTPRKSRPLNFGLNARSVGNALVTFNLVMLIQTGLDATYLWGGAALPEGMSYAQYAHRGAYPLVLTALLAGAFALAARPYLGERRMLRWLVYLWLAQNLLLVASSMLRLSLYVEAYGLTHLRINAAIWMGLVAVGLGLTLWQIWRGQGNRWLLTRCAGLGVGVLYACCFVNFAALIADHNLRHHGARDGYYLCSLGPMAAGPLLSLGGDLPCDIETPVLGNWREWGFRTDRVIRNLPQISQPESAYENPRGR